MSAVAVFGTGPSGMAVAWAAIAAGYHVHFYSNTDAKSTLYGCQYLHAEIPVPKRFEISQAHVEYRLVGTADEYRHKVYGDAWEGNVSPEDLAGEHDAWDIRATYDALWELITSSPMVGLRPANIGAGWIASQSKVLSQYDHVVSTIPAPSVCEHPAFTRSMSGHMFASHTVKAVGSVMPYPVDANYVVCDGTSETDWYRNAVVFGYQTTEWPRKQRVDAVTVRKPLFNECDCHPEVIRLGRYGAWRKGILVHNVYEDAVKLFNGEWVSE